MTQNCSFLHHSSMLTPLHLSSKIPVAMIDPNNAIKKRLANVLIWRKKTGKQIVSEANAAFQNAFIK